MENILAVHVDVGAGAVYRNGMRGRHYGDGLAISAMFLDPDDLREYDDEYIDDPAGEPEESPEVEDDE